jgi:hypothetical protein
MNIPFPNKTDRHMFFQTDIGNAGNGGQPNPPTIPNQQPGTFPRVNLSKEFVIGGYNNQLESFHFPRFTKSWEDKFYSNNPIGFQSWTDAPGGPVGLQGNGNNQNGAGYTPSSWAPYNVASLGAIAGNSQSYPYNKNALNPDGGVQNAWNFTDNVNEGEEQDVVLGVEALPSPEEAQRMYEIIKRELDEGNEV